MLVDPTLCYCTLPCVIVPYIVLLYPTLCCCLDFILPMSWGPSGCFMMAGGAGRALLGDPEINKYNQRVTVAMGYSCYDWNLLPFISYY